MRRKKPRQPAPKAPDKDPQTATPGPPSAHGTPRQAPQEKEAADPPRAGENGRDQRTTPPPERRPPEPVPPCKGTIPTDPHASWPTPPASDAQKWPPRPGPPPGPSPWPNRPPTPPDRRHRAPPALLSSPAPESNRKRTTPPGRKTKRSASQAPRKTAAANSCRRCCGEIPGTRIAVSNNLICFSKSRRLPLPNFDLGRASFN